MNRSFKRLLNGAALGLGLAVAAALTAFAISCSPGLGTELDLSGPTLTITSHKNLDYVGKDLLLSGTCTDNEKVTRVVVQNVTTGDTYSNAVVAGDTWSINLNLPEGEETLKVTAYDKNSNASVSSVKQITLLVDATNPFMKSLEILRMPGITTSLKERSALEALEADDSANIDSFQNGTFTIRGAAVENYSLSSVVLKLYDESANLVLTKSMPAGSNMTTPSFTITQSDLVSVNAAYATGRHYLRATVTNTDIGGNTNTDQFEWLCWYPEADYARIKQSMTKDGLLVLPKDTAIPVEYFDDDSLSEVYVKMVKADDWSALSGATDAAKLQALIDSSSARTALFGPNVLSQAQRIWEYTLPATWSIGQYVLVSLAKDVKTDGSDAVWSSRLITVKVTDQDSPLTIITGPSENTFPTLSSFTTFYIAGYCLDNGNPVDMKIAWVPNGLSGSDDAKIAAAQNLLTASTLASGSSAVDSSGVKIWSVSLGSSSSRILNGKTYQEKDFSVPINIFTDFMYGGSLENKLKLFVIMTVDNDGNRVFQTFRLQGDTTAPVVSVVNPSAEMQVYSLDNDLTLSFTASKANGLDIDSYSLTDITDSANPVALTLTTVGALRQATIDQATLAGYGECRRTYQFIAKDKLGNEAKEQRTVILSDLPVLQYVSSGEMDKTYKAGDAITVQAVFSKPVKVTGSPRLDLRYYSGDSTAKYATYIQGSGTDTLLFSYTVPVSAVSNDLCCSTAPINLNGSAITTTEGTGGNAIIAGLNGVAVLDAAKLLQAKKDIVLEGTIPSISAISISGGKAVGGKQYFKAGDLMTITLTSSESVSVSGSPTLNLNGGIVGTFYKTSGSSVVFTHVVGMAENVSSVTWTPASAFSASDLAMISDVAGNAISSVGGTLDPNAVLDTTVPVAPTYDTLLISSGSFNVKKTLALESIETNATAEYSLDGGLAWTTFTASQDLYSGTYSITARQTDAAGNQSPNSPMLNVEINNVFPAINSASCEQPTGTYAKDATLTFKLSFSAKVKTDASSSITISDGTQTATVYATEETAGATVLYFSYKVPGGISMTGAKPTVMNLSGVTDMYGNSTAATTAPVWVGGTITIDSVVPTFAPASSTPTNGGIAAGLTSIQLAFSEPVFAESGNITIKPSGNWIVPPVMTEADFSTVYYSSALSSSDQADLMQGSDGSPTTDPTTGLCLGPYQKTTQGITTSGGNYVPDTATKYVLRYDLDPASTTDPDVVGIRNALVKAGYNKQTIDVSAASYVSTSGNTVTITFPTTLPKGRLWDVIIPEGAFRDAAGNKTAEIALGNYTFWSNGVSTPVIRVRRYSYGDIPSGGVPGSMTAPTGTTDVRIDCETPGSTIKYATLLKGSTTATKQVSENKRILSTIADATVANVTGMSPTTSYSAGTSFAVGDGTYTTAEKYYIAARATKSGTDSDNGYEGAYKTLIVHYFPQYSYNGGTLYNHVIQGSTIQGGIPTISGFPLRDAHTDRRYSKYCYMSGSTTTTTYSWVSWEIVCTFYTQGKYSYPGGNFQDGYDQVDAGSALGTYYRHYYGAGGYTSQAYQ